MHRRSLLTALSVGLAGFAGCVQGPLDAGRGRSPGDGAVDVWGPEPPCPAAAPTADRTVCTGGGHPAPTGVAAALDPPPSPTVPVEQPVPVSLRPRTDVPLTFDPRDWTLRRFDGDDWTTVASGSAPGRYTTLYTAETYEWTLGAESPTTRDGHALVPPRSPGRYAFSVTASVGRGWTYGDRYECVALFAVDGE